MAEDRLLEGRAYVQRLRNRGHRDGEIARALAAAGWKASDVAALLSSDATKSTAAAEESERSRTPRAAKLKPPRSLTISLAFLAIPFALVALTALVVFVWAAWDIQVHGPPSGFPGQMGFGYVVILVAIGIVCLVPLSLCYPVWRGRKWARGVMIVVLGILAVVSLPLGVVFVPIIWVLYTPEVEEYCSR